MALGLLLGVGGWSGTSTVNGQDSPNNAEASPRFQVTGVVSDMETGEWLPARIYIRDDMGTSWFVDSLDPAGSAIAYQEQWVPLAGSEELHTTVSAHPFQVQLPKGEYTVSVERGKEYMPQRQQFSVRGEGSRLHLALRRWSHVAEQGWYSGETHVHRRVRELPNVMLAEDLNVAFPVTYWTIKGGESPGLAPSPLRRQGPSPYGPRIDRGYEPILVDKTHVMFPRNTEYEIFQVGGERHVLGAVFILNHRTQFQNGMPPVGAIAKLAHSEGALLDLDKHSWPWSMMLIPIAKIDLYELANNSLWKTRFGFRNSMVRPGDYMKIEAEGNLLTEAGWIDWGFQNYYALLNCGFPLQPTAGTASGVHPVPLGFGRVYVHVTGPFSPEKWLNGLRRGNSFVTTGPIIQATVNSQHPGHRFASPDPQEVTIEGQIRSIQPLDRVEIVINGIPQSVEVAAEQLESGATQVVLKAKLTVAETSWVAIRCEYRDEEGRVRFAHTAPWHIQIGDQPIRPRREEVDYLIKRMTDEIERSRTRLSVEALAEFEEALRQYREIAKRAK